MSLYIQEGFRVYGIEGAYEAYFGSIEEEDEPLSKYDSYFYLTDDGIGIITFVSRYYSCLEAKFEDLGIEGF